VNAKQPEQQGLFVASLDEPAARRRWLPTAMRAEYQSRHLLFVRDQTLLAQPFDDGRGTPAGEPIAVAHPVEAWRTAAGWGWFSARKGTLLAYKEGAPARSELVWFDRKGARLATVGDAADYVQLALSPDERQVAVQVRDGVGSDIWTVDLARGVGTRQTSSPGDERSPTWSRDGREIFFAATHEGATSIQRKALSGGEPETVTTASAEDWIPEGVSHDGNDLLYHAQTGPRHGIGTLSLEASASPRPILEAREGLDEPQLSPDGRFLAYGAQESGTWQVFVEPYGRKGERVRISTDSGAQPEWRGDGREIFYITRAGSLAAVEVRATSERLEVSLPLVLFEGLQWQATIDTYAAARDGQRFLAIIPVGSSARGRIHVVTNWTSRLEAR
jgi:dipeptidyl aminopeptidase/acylaminoacyl peptidase